MKFETERQVKKWLGGLPLLRKDLAMKSEFFADLIYESKKRDVGLKHEPYYREQIDILHERLKALEADVEKVLEILDPDEKAILTARYIKRLMWDAMEFHVHYSRRQSIRIHNRAIKKLVGTEI